LSKMGSRFLPSRLPYQDSHMSLLQVVRKILTRRLKPIPSSLATCPFPQMGDRLFGQCKTEIQSTMTSLVHLVSPSPSSRNGRLKMAAKKII